MSKRQVHFIANCVYGDHVAGGDIHFFNMAQATIEAGHPLHFFGGHALKQHLERRKIDATITLTDGGVAKGIDMDRFGGQVRLFKDYGGRLRGTLRQKDEIGTEDMAYSVTDYWFDTWPVIRSRSQRKLMVLGMDAPTFGQVAMRTRPDVTASRVNSIYYWLSQNLSLRWFRRCQNKRVFYVHPSMQPRLLKMGYAEREIVFISNGFDLETAESVPDQAKEYDVVWVGRYHRQKGIEDLLTTLRALADQVKGFRAVLVGKLEHDLKPEIDRMGLATNVQFSGLVSEYEKFRLFKASRMFLMPSTYESWGIVIGEALACGIPVVAYELAAYRPIFGELVNYVQPFDLQAFQQTASQALLNARAGRVNLDQKALQKLKDEHSWAAARKRFQRTLGEFAQ